MPMIRKAHLLTEEQIEFLETIDELSASEHLRRAIDDYRKKIEREKLRASTSPKLIQVSPDQWKLETELNV